MTRELVTIDGNEAAAYVAHKTNEVIAIYPITPSSSMGEHADAWSAQSKPNIWGTVPLVVEMQSEGGAAGAVHGALQAGSLTTTFTASQGLLLMIPNMYKIAGELTPTVFHIAARSLAAQALSIFGDHSDVMAARATGWAMLFSGSVQEIMDLALVAQASTLAARVPFLHIFDGFRSSSEVQRIERLADADIRAMIDDELVRAHRARAMSPDRPIMRGTAQNPDVFFQARETINPYYEKVPEIVQQAMDKLAGLTGRQYHLFDYVGAEDAEKVIVLMGSGTEAAHETVEYLAGQGEKVGVVKVHLYRPFSVKHFLGALPSTVKVIAALDRTKEPGAIGEPLYQDVLTALAEGMADGTAPFTTMPKVIGGRYGLSSKEFNPAMIKGVFDEMGKADPKKHFTVGINDDVTHMSIEYDPNFDVEPDDVIRCMFWGLGADGTVGANKNSVKIIGEETPNYAQGYFVYDSKRSGARTISHVRFGRRPIHSTYLIKKANFVAVHQFGFLKTYDVLGNAAEGATFLLNSPYPAEETWDHMPRKIQQQVIDKKLKLYVINAYDVAQQTGMGVRINTIMQTCFFYVSGVLPQDEAIAKIKEAIEKTYGKRGEAVVKKNYAAVDAAVDNLHKIGMPGDVTSDIGIPPVVSPEAPEFVQKVTAEMMAGRGDLLPVSMLPEDGTYPTATTQWEKRNIALWVPEWDPEICIQCGKCVLVCPHAAIRAKLVDKADLAGAPESFKYAEARFKEYKDKLYTLQVAVEDCTGCELCVENCPAKNKAMPSRKAINMVEQIPLRERERANWDFFLSLPEVPRVDGLKFSNVKNVQLLRPLFEFSGACAGCGEAPYVRLATQLFGDRMIIANATGCSSIYGGNLPTTPYCVNHEGRGPTWNNSLFEDNAEFGFGMRLTVDKQTQFARELVEYLKGEIGAELAGALLSADQSDEAGIFAQRARVAELKQKLEGMDGAEVRNLLAVADFLVKKSVWVFGGDGWAYDIGYGGLDHVLAQGRNVNVLVLDTEVYSNTGGQSSKATPLSAVAQFAAGGKPTPKKDLGMMAMAYGNVYVAQVAMGANDVHTIRAMLEAESYEGPSLIIAYTHCIMHGIPMSKGLNQQKLAVDSGHWPLYRFDPRLKDEGKNPFQLDSKAPKIPLKDYIYNETRYSMLTRSFPDVADRLLAEAQAFVNERWAKYEHLAAVED
ncbi:MAG: pyruvate:ferredoxin (flavodoxin) oxidoreductase [Anaerolineae bacterium]|nr:pyruvate:ferredoxin (flavodoxin) oxidoreductase [Anaerolineae bacterium]